MFCIWILIRVLNVRIWNDPDPHLASADLQLSLWCLLFLIKVWLSLKLCWNPDWLILFSSNEGPTGYPAIRPSGFGLGNFEPDHTAQNLTKQSEFGPTKFDLPSPTFIAIWAYFLENLKLEELFFYTFKLYMWLNHLDKLFSKIWSFLVLLSLYMFVLQVKGGRNGSNIKGR